MSQPQKRIVFWIAIIALLLRLALVVRPEARLYSRPYIDDTFYALGCAWNIAQGHGLTSDGIHPTNGIQPLIVALDVPLFLIAGNDKALGIQLTIALQALIDAISIYLFAKLIAALQKKRDAEKPESLAPIIGALLWATLYNFFRQNMNGLETGLYALFILSTLLNYLQLDRTNDRRLRSWALFGFQLGLLVLTRIDAVFIVLGICAVELWRKKSNALLPLITMGIASLLISSPWWIFNYVNFGSIMPQSGQSEALGVHFGSNVFDGAVAIADILATVFYFPYQEFPIWSRWLWCALVPFLFVVVVWRYRIVRKIRDGYDLRPLAPLVLANIGFIVFYVFFFAAWWFLYRYFHPVRMLWTILLSIGVAEFVLMQIDAKRKCELIVISVIALCALTFNGQRYLSNFTTNDIYPGYLVGKWAMQHPNAKIAMEQSGTASFVAPNITNLDGKVNPDALKARRMGAIGEYIVKNNFDYLIDWEIIAGPLTEKANQAGGKFVRDSVIGTMVVYRNTSGNHYP